MSSSDDIASEMAKILKTAEKYAIAPNDNFWDIANRFKITVDDLKAANPNVNPSALQLGQEIVIPTGPELEAIRKKRELPKSIRGQNLQKQIDAAIKAAAAANGISEDILRGLIFAESTGDICASSATGARGLCQIMPQTAVLVGVSTPMDPVQNVYGGAKWLGAFYREAKKLLIAYPNSGYSLDQLALMLYNAGGPMINQVLKGKATLKQETIDYPQRVLSNRGKKMTFFCSTGEI